MIVLSIYMSIAYETFFTNSILRKIQNTDNKYRCSYEKINHNMQINDEKPKFNSWP